MKYAFVAVFAFAVGVLTMDVATEYRDPGHTAYSRWRVALLPLRVPTEPALTPAQREQLCAHAEVTRHPCKVM